MNLVSPDFQVGDDVRYAGVGRPYLKDLPGEIISFNIPKTSAFVQFKRENGQVYEEWIGVGSITKSDPVVNSVEDLIRNELREVNEKFTTVQTEYRKLSSRKGQLEAALRALNATFR